MDKKQVYKTNAVIVIGFAMLGFYFKANWLYAISGAVFLITVLSFSGAKLIANRWMFVGKTLGNFNAKVILSVFFFLILFPISLIKRLFTIGHIKQQLTTWQMPDKEKVLDLKKLF